MDYSAIEKEIRSQMRYSVRNSFENVITKNAPTSVSPVTFNIASKYNYYSGLIEYYIKRKVEENCLTEYETSDIERRVRRDLETAFRSNSMKIKNDWKIYGSYSYGLACKDSDLDFHNGSFDDISHDKAENLIKYVWEFLEKNSAFDRMSVIPKARIPLVVLTHKSTGKECSISFSSEMGIAKSSMMKLYLKLNSNLKTLTLFLRHVLVQYELNETNKITNYVLFWLVVFFMQQKKQLPTVEEVRRTVVTRHFIHNWDCSVPNSYNFYQPYSSESIGSLYFGFLEFYKDFNFVKYVISPYLGCALPIEEFENWQIPSEALRNRRSNGDGVHSFCRKFMNLQDICILTRNVTMNIPEEVANDFRAVCGYLYEPFHEYLNNGRVFDIDSLSKFESTKGSLTDVNRVASIDLEFKSIAEKRVELKPYFIDTVRRLMETLFEFKCKKIVDQVVSKIDRDRGDPVQTKMKLIYFDYCADYRTLRNKFVKSIIKESSLKENLCVFFMCEISGDSNINLMVDGNAQFVEFMQECGKELLECVSK